MKCWGNCWGLAIPLVLALNKACAWMFGWLMLGDFGWECLGGLDAKCPGLECLEC